MKLLLSLSLLLPMALQQAQAVEVFSLDYAGANRGDANTAVDNAGGRRYTTFSIDSSNSGGLMVSLSGDNSIVGGMNSNSGAVNPGPGFFYIPTGVAWEPNKTYTVDFNVYNQAGFGDNPAIDFGLWAGVPADAAGFTELGSGGQYSGLSGTAPPQIQSALGTQGFVELTPGVKASEIPENDLDIDVLASDLSTFQQNIFTTGADVSGLDDMVVFVRNNSLGSRLFWDNLTVSAVPEPSSAAALAILGGGICVARRRRSSSQTA